MRATATTTEGAPSTCPLCGEVVGSAGAGFDDHLADSPACDASFDGWRYDVASGLTTGWTH